MLKSFLFLAALVIGNACAQAGSLAVDTEKSSLDVDVKATGHSFTVNIQAYHPEIVMSPEGKVESVSFSFSPKALKSDNAKRDKKMFGWLEVESHPQISFVMKDIEQDGMSGKLIGDLSLHGVTQQVEVPFTIDMADDTITINGSSVVDYQDFDLDIITMFFMKVHSEMNLSFSLVGSLES